MRGSYCKVTSKRELVEATVALNWGLSADYDVPPDWEPSDEAWAQAQRIAVLGLSVGSFVAKVVSWRE